jgi:hypothetical protein
MLPMFHTTGLVIRPYLVVSLTVGLPASPGLRSRIDREHIAS